MRVGRFHGSEDFIQVTDTLVELLTSEKYTSIDIHPEIQDISKINWHNINNLGIYHTHEGRYININRITYEIDISKKVLLAERTFIPSFRHIDKIPTNRSFLALGSDDEVREQFESSGYRLISGMRGGTRTG